MVCSQAPPVYGGAGTQALALATHLARRGCVVDVLTGNQLLAPCHETRDGVTIRRSRGERLVRKLPTRIAEIMRTATLMLSLTAWLARRKYDVYHVHGNYWFAIAPLIFARLTRAPFVLKITRLDDDDAETSAHKRAGPFPAGWIYAAPMRLASLVIAVNSEIARRHRSRFPNVPVACLPNGVDTTRFTVTGGKRAQVRREHRISQDASVALFVGHLTPRKGVTELLDAWHEFVARRTQTDTPALLLLVGPGSGFYRELSPALSGRVASASARETGVRWLSHLAPESMPDIYAAADVFVLPTRSEGMPNSMLEALACGLPVIAARVPGVTEVLERDVGASILIDSPACGEILGALQAAMSVRQDKPRHRRAARIPPQFTLEQLADTYLDIYRRLGTRDHAYSPHSGRIDSEEVGDPW
jgi:glycosyltransferase involved in cell wall biosynthesis